MATNNTLGTLAATGVFHDALGITLKKLPFLSRMARNIAPEMAEKNIPFNVQQILKDYNAAQTVYDRAATGTYAVTAGQVLPADKFFTLGYWPAISIKLSATEVNQIIDSNTNKDARSLAVQKLLTRGFNALGLGIVNRLLSVITAANFANNYASAVGTMDYKKLGSGVDVLLTADALSEKPDAILEVACYREFANSLSPIPNFSGVDEVVREASISEPVSGANSASRYNIVMPADASRGVIFDPQAIVYANRVPIEETVPNDPVYLEIITDPATGFSLLYREAKDPNTGEVTRTITTMIDFAVGLQNHLVRLTPA